MVSWSDIKKWKSAQVDEVVEGLIDRRKKAVEVHEHVGQIDVSSDWEGAGAKAAQGSLDKLKSANMKHLGLVSDLLSASQEAFEGVGEVERTVREIQEEARAQSIDIGDDGKARDLNPPVYKRSGGYQSDSDPSADTRYGKEYMEHQERVKNIERRIEEVCKRAQEVDDAFRNRLDGAADGKVSNQEDFNNQTPGLPDLPSDMSDSKKNAQWWHSLSDSERDAIKKKAVEDIKAGRGSKYEALGNMNGVDGATRNEINKARAEDENKKLHDELKDMTNPGPGKHRIILYGSIFYARDGESNEGFTKRYNNLDKRIRETDGVIDAVKNKNVGLYLYEPATGEKGHEATHAAYVSGDIDKADHVSTFTPGMGTTVADSGGNIDRMNELKNRAEAQGKGSVATVTWVGYDAPPGLTDAATTGRAETGGRDLAKHLEGIKDMRDVSHRPVHQSVLGHSYGSTTSSYALKQVRPGVVGDYLVFGSPGVAGKAEEMHVPQGHAHSMFYTNHWGSAGDFIASPNMVGNAAKHPLGPGQAIIFGNEGAIGHDPSDSQWGFGQMDPGKSGTMNPVEAHSKYFVDGSQAQSNMVKVAVGEAG